MLSFDPFAFRPGGPEPVPEADAPVLGPAPDRVAMPTREARGPRLRRVSASTLVSGAVHVALAIAFLAVWHAMMKAVKSAPESIAVEIVTSIPGEDPKPPPPPPAPPPAPKAAEAPPPAPEPPAPPPPAPSVLDQALPQVVVPPPEPKAAATQSTVNQTGNTVQKSDGTAHPAAGTPDAPPTSKRETATPPPVPKVLAAPESDVSVPAPAPKAEDPKPPTSGDASSAQKDATAQLAAALPMGTMSMPLTFRAALSAQGNADSAAYRGSVFGAIGRVQREVAEEAEAKQLKGQVVLVIELTETGTIAAIKVLQTSGSAAADAFAVSMIRRAAPFPPPPPGASRRFTPAIAFGEG